VLVPSSTHHSTPPNGVQLQSYEGSDMHFAIKASSGQTDRHADTENESFAIGLALTPSCHLPESRRAALPDSFNVANSMRKVAQCRPIFQGGTFHWFLGQGRRNLVTEAWKVETNVGAPIGKKRKRRVVAARLYFPRTNRSVI